MTKKTTNLPTQLEQIDKQIQEHEKAVSNYDKFIREGHCSKTIAENLAVAEKKLNALKIEHYYLKSKVENKVYVTPSAIKNKMTSLGDILSKKLVEANQILKNIFPEKIKMTPQVSGKKRFYKASGVISLYALQKFSTVVDGGRCRARTCDPYLVRVVLFQLS